MRLHAKRSATHLSWSGTALVGLGIALGAPEILASGGALLASVALSRALTLISVARARAAGFEMLWMTQERTQKAQRQVGTVLRAELRNHDALPTRFRSLVAMHSPTLEVSIAPQEGEIPAQGTLAIELHVTPQRVGYHGIHGLTLETIRAPGLFSIPLSFSNPFVLEVLPRSVALSVSGVNGRASRHQSPDGVHGRLRGDGPEFRELREHRPGDAYRSIAWKASARRGRLLVVENEQQQRDVVWLFVEVSRDAFNGPIGQAGIDQSIEAAVRLAEGHLARGDVVGLQLVGSKSTSRVPLGRGPRHAAQLISLLSLDAHCAHAERSDWDEREVARRVLEHLRGLDHRASHLAAGDTNGLARLAALTLERAPVQPKRPRATSALDGLLREYLLAFGIHPPAQTASDRSAVLMRMAEAMTETLTPRPRPGIFYVFAQPPHDGTPADFLQALRACKRRRVKVRFVPLSESLPVLESGGDQKQLLARAALSERVELASSQSARQLHQLGVEVLSGRGRDQFRRKSSARSTSS